MALATTAKHRRTAGLTLSTANPRKRASKKRGRVLLARGPIPITNYDTVAVPHSTGKTSTAK